MAEEKKTDTKEKPWPLVLVILLIVSVIVSSSITIYCFEKEEPFRKETKKDEHGPHPHPEMPEESWRFIVAGDSRNCGDVVMPAIAAHSAKNFQPVFYWHLGDLRYIYQIDEDMVLPGQALACKDYLKQAWPDFIEHQIYPFGKTPFYAGIGNHEVVPPKGYPPGSPEATKPEVNAAQFTSQFADWLLSPVLKEQRLKDHDCDKAPPAKAGEPTTSSKAECLIFPRNYYHWIQGGVDFLYLDNASNVFGREQLDWFKERMKRARSNPEVQSVVVGMHEALPDSISSSHAMCDKKKKDDPKYPYDLSCQDGNEVYQELLDFQNELPKKHVYVLASHSHYVMDGIFNNRPVTQRLHGWIVGTAGAVRYKLADDSNLSNFAKTDVYGYLLGTVDKEGNIRFEFKELKESDVAPETRQRYPAQLVSWCFSKNSQNLDPASSKPDKSKDCLQPVAAPETSPKQ